jgi:hypothetical protein
MELTYVILSHIDFDLFVFNGAVFLILTTANGNCQMKTGEYLLFVKAQMSRRNTIGFALLSSALTD